tara:strand:+ start:106 stop:783 length:678 start_codon:yes stop_codon:yes gene_type:complete
MKLPIFPLDLVLYPNQTIPLRIFEPRYRQMLDDCMSSDRKFGICRVKNGTEKSGWNGPDNTGTIAHVLKCEDLDLTGTNYYIELIGEERFKITKLIQPALDKPLAYNPPNNPSMQTMLQQVSGKPLYFQAEIELLPTLNDLIKGDKWIDIISSLEIRIKEAASKIGVEFDDFSGFIEHNGLNKKKGSIQDFYNIASMCSLSLDTQQAILEASTIENAINLLNAEL